MNGFNPGHPFFLSVTNLVKVTKYVNILTFVM